MSVVVAGTWARTAGPSTRDEGSTGDAVNGKSKLSEIYLLADPQIHRPRHRAGAVGQEAQDHRQQRIRPRSSGCSIRRSTRFTDEQHRLLSGGAARARSTRINDLVYPNVNNGVYRAGFATTQDAYEEAFRDAVRRRSTSWSAGCRGSAISPAPRITEADWRLFTTLIRFDAVYYGHFKCNLRRIDDYPNLSNYLRDLYQAPGVAETVSFEHIKRHYYGSQRKVNPTGIVPLGPELDFTAPHDRDRFVS